MFSRLAFLLSLFCFGVALSPGTGAASLQDGDIVWYEDYFDDDFMDFEDDGDPDALIEARCTGDVSPICRMKVVERCESWQFCAPFFCCSRWRRTTTKWYFPRTT